MARRIFEAALQNRLMTVILIIVFVAIGLRAMLLLPIDASPDVTPNVVQIVTDAPGLHYLSGRSIDAGVARNQ
jgi:cobalt-zinc-cadmium resistance protein CzcA